MKFILQLALFFSIFLKLNGAYGVKISWEKYPENYVWSDFMYQLLDSELFETLDTSADMNRFCPNYAELNRENRISIWIEFFSQVSLYESRWNPLSRMKENLGIDPITGTSVYSEGLLQLSYQDMKNYSNVLNDSNCKIDWEKDKSLNSKSPQKTILDPLINLECGARIMAHQILKRKNIVLYKGVYWNTLKENGKYSAIPKIERFMKKIKMCRLEAI